MTPLEKLNQILKKKSSTTSTSQILLEIERERKISNSFYKASIILLWKSDKDTNRK